jgi:hypothetical protein
VGGGSTCDVIEEQLRPMLIGEDPLLIEGPWQRCSPGRANTAAAASSERDWHRYRAVDIAGKGRAAAIASSAAVATRRAHASGGFYQEGKSADELAGRPRATVPAAQGMKMKINPSTQTHLAHLVEYAELRPGRARRRPSPGSRRCAAALGPRASTDGRRQLRVEPGDGDRMAARFEPYDL